MIYLTKMPILAILGHFWPVFDLLRPWYICQTLPTSIFVLVLTGLSKIGQKILNNCDQFDKNADFGHFRSFLACFWPVMAPVWVLKGPNEYIFPNSEWNEWDLQKNSE